MIDLIIVGTGAVAAELTSNMAISEYIWNGEKIRIKGYLEYDEYRYLHREYHYEAPILGTIDNYKILDTDYFVIANANNTLRIEFAEKLKEKNAKFINLIHPSCIVSKTSQMGIGNILSPFCQIGPLSKLEDFNILTSFSCISHDSNIGSFNFFSSCIVCGHCVIGNNNNFYIRSTVVPHVSIGNGCTIQSGMMVDKNVPDESTIFYRYKEKTMAVPKQ